jgi:nitrate/nitrite-specific signal transduction histidine kinase
MGNRMKKNWWSNLQVKIITWSFIPTVIILSAVAWFTFYSYQKVLGDLAIKQNLEIIQSKIQQIVEAYNNLIGPVIVPIYYFDKKYELTLEVRAQNILDQVQGLDIFDGGIYFLDQQGKVFKTKPTQPDLIGQDWSDTPTFRFIKEHPNAGAVTDLLTIGPSGKKIICSAVAMTDQQGKYVGLGYYCFTFYPATQNAFYIVLKSLDLNPNLFVLDRNENIVFSADPAEIGKDVSGKASIQWLLQEESKSGRFRNGIEDVVVSYVPISKRQDIGWIVLNEQSWDEIMQPTLAYRQLLLVLLALGVLVPALVTAYGVKHITNPIQKLIQVSKQVTAGKFKHRITVKTGDEIETLADQFNLMSVKLDDSYSSLEKKVAARTRELAILNSIISVASHSLNIQEVLEDALDKTVEQMGFKAGVAFEFESHPASPHLMAQHGFEPAIVTDFLNSYMSEVRKTPEIYPDDVSTFGLEDFQDEKLKDHLSHFGLHLLVFVPLTTKGHKLGFFILGRHKPAQLSPEESSLLRSIGQQIGVAMENAHLFEQAEHTAITAERGRLARELHDAVTQTLFSANLIADVIPRIWKRNPEEGLRNLEELRQLTRGALAEMRTLLLEMRPESLQRSDIKSLLTQLADAFIGRVRVPVSLVIQGECELTHEVKIVFYRVAQEALNNIAKHSGARQVELRLEYKSGHMNMLIKDDGLGFEPDAISPGHLGIAIMHERANSIEANLKIESQSGQGTTVELDWKQERKD